MPGSLLFGPFGLQPRRVLEDSGRSWAVTAIVEHQRDRDWRLFGPATATEWWVVRARAMQPDAAGDWREAELQVTVYNDRPGWWVETLEGG